MTSNSGTYWNGEPADAKIVKVIVGKSERPTWWCADMEGQEAEAIEVTQHGQTFHIFNDRDGRYKVTFGFGSPQVGHKGLPVAEVLEDVSGVVEYMVKHKDETPPQVRKRPEPEAEEEHVPRTPHREFVRRRKAMTSAIKRRALNKRERINRRRAR